MITPKSLLSDLQKLLKRLEDDIRQRCESQPEVNEPLRRQYDAAREHNRTAQAYEVWRDEQITQAAVAWILGCVFIRFCEDNHLVDPPRLSGPGERRKRAEDEHTLYFQKHPTDSDREYLQWVFEQVAQLPAMRELFDRRHNPLWSLAISGDGAMALREFWLKRDPATGLLQHDFTDPAFTGASPDQPPTLRSAPSGPSSTTNHQPPTTNSSPDPTRFLGDLYQDLSESARKRYALLQTPVFVEEFILDRTLEPAIREFGFKEVRMIDPTCGSGHFLLGGFHRLFDLWVKAEPATNIRELARRALSQVYGVDLNPFAIAIARFRLLVAALRACGIERLADAPAFTVNLATGDSLLHGPRPNVIGGRQQYLLGEDPLAQVYDTEDAPLLQKILGQQYHAVVGNPPYITIDDAALNEAYRARFSTCHRQYSLVAPFTERFTDLAAGSQPGFVGFIVANSFMKREYGKRLVETFLRFRDITHVIDSSQAHIPGHGTPTVILFLRPRPPSSSKVRAVLSIRGEPTTPDDPSKGLVWSDITTCLDRPNTVTEFIEVTDLPRELLNEHPWVLDGGGITNVLAIIEANKSKLSSVVADSGRAVGIGDEEAYILEGFATARRLRVNKTARFFIVGESVRDWLIQNTPVVIYPFQGLGGTAVADMEPALKRHLWRHRSHLRTRTMFNRTLEDRGQAWWEYLEHYRDRLGHRVAITYGNIATHNHFAVDEQLRVYNCTAPVVVLTAEYDREAYWQLAAVLNSSVVCFWLRRKCNPKGSSGIGRGVYDEAWERHYSFTDTKLQECPLPRTWLASLARELRDAVLEISAMSARPANLTEWAQRRSHHRHSQGKLIALQEEADWECYGLYGLLDQPPLKVDPPAIWFGQRAFEIVLARQMAAGEVQTTWFARHGSTPITEIPAEWPEDYKQVVRRRIEIIETDKNIGLIERPEYKRRWNTEPWEDKQERALRSWLLDRLEGWPLTEQESSGAGEQEKSGAGEQESKGPRSLVWDERAPRLMSVAQLADRMRADRDFMQVAALYRGREDFDVTRLVAELVEDESVPLLPVLRYKESGLRNRRVWEQVWDLQRQEDAIEAQAAQGGQSKIQNPKSKMPPIPVPPKYKSADMLNGTIWRLRGKLDVPKERFVSFPHCQRDSDPTLLVTWAGFDHLQQMQALAAFYMDMKEREGWPPDRRAPLLAGMLELLPWVLQWHNDPDKDHQLRLGDYYRDFIQDEARGMGKTVEQVKAWKPEGKAGRGKKAKE